MNNFCGKFAQSLGLKLINKSQIRSIIIIIKINSQIKSAFSAWIMIIEQCMSQYFTLRSIIIDAVEPDLMEIRYVE
jgi:hypothetical protein